MTNLKRLLKGPEVSSSFLTKCWTSFTGNTSKALLAWEIVYSHICKLHLFFHFLWRRLSNWNQDWDILYKNYHRNNDAWSQIMTRFKKPQSVMVLFCFFVQLCVYKYICAGICICAREWGRGGVNMNSMTELQPQSYHTWPLLLCWHCRILR